VGLSDLLADVAPWAQTVFIVRSAALTIATLVLVVSACGTTSGIKTSANTAATQTTTSASASFGRFDSLRAAAASISRDCPSTAGSGLPPQIALHSQGTGAALWLPAAGAPLVYSANVYGVPVTARKTGSRAGVFSSRGLAVRLPDAGQSIIALWPCRPPVLFYFTDKWIKMKALAGSRRDQTTRTLVNGSALNGATLDSQGRLIRVEEHKIVYSDGTTIVPRGIPTFSTWHIQYIAPWPRNPSVFVAEVVNNDSPGGPRTGRLYLVNSSAIFLHFFDNARYGPVVEWSRAGSKILYAVPNALPERGMSIYVADSEGRHRRLVANVLDGVRSALWSPDGTEIAFTEGLGYGPTRVAVVDVASGVVRLLTPITWSPPRPPRPAQPPSARVLAWSPDSKSVAVLSATADDAQTVVETIPATGGPPDVLIRLPLYKGPPIK
jgi:hypothetical protein